MSIYKQFMPVHTPQDASVRGVHVMDDQPPVLPPLRATTPCDTTTGLLSLRLGALGVVVAIAIAVTSSCS